MLPQRQAHSAGATRVCLDGAHVLTGGADGVVALYPLKRWPSCPQLWARQCHDGAVTSVVLHDALGLAISCGRDGNVVLHENVAAVSTSRVLCRVTGEVRCVLFDAERQRVFIAGDSLRYLQMRSTGCSVHVVPPSVPHPLVGLALSPCGSLLAMASASGAVGVVSVCTATAANAGDKPQQENALAGRLQTVRLALPNLLSHTVKRDDSVAYRLCWCRSGAGSLLLFVPGVTEVRAMRLEEAASLTSSAHSLRHVGSIDSLGMTDLLGVMCYPLSTHIFCVVLFSTTAILVAKVDERKWGVTRLKGENFTDLTDAYVDAKSGDLVVGTRDGVVTYLQREAPKAALTMKKAHADGDVPTHGTSQNKRTRKETLTHVGTDDSNINNNKKNDHDDENNNIDISGSSYSDGSSDAEDDDGASSSSSVSVMKENFRQVVDDLKRDNPHYKGDDNEEERPSRWRQENPKEVVRMVEETCDKRRSIFLDDEAEESSDDAGGGDGSMEEEGYRGREYGHNLEDDVASVGELRLNGSLAPSQSSNRSIRRATAAGSSVFSDYSFQIGATPPGEEGSCYLAYNSVGYIHATADGTTVHFHDMSLQAVRVLERGTILMAALSPVGAAFVLAQELDMDSVDDDTPRLTVYFRTFVALGAQSDWRAQLCPGETVRCLTVGVRHVAVATCRYLRLFSLSGLEIAVLSLFPFIVAMVGTNSNKVMQSLKVDFDPLAVCYLEASGQMRMQVLDVGSRSVVAPPVVVPLTTQPDGSLHQLQWMGWSEDGPLHVADTAGVLQMFTLNWGGSWVPVLDPRCLLDQTYNLWIWGVSDEAVFAYRSCKSDPPYPAAVASGLPTEHVRLFLPLTRCGTERDMVTWDHLLRREVRADEVKRHSTFYTPLIAKHDALHDKKIMDLFKNALKEQQTSRAIDLAYHLELRDNIELCAKEANAQGHGQVLQKLLTLLESRMKRKRKRLCPLPLEGSVVTERERDMLLRKLLAKEKINGTMNAGGGGGGDDDGGVSQTAEVEVVQTEKELFAGNTTTPVKPATTTRMAATSVTPQPKSSAGNAPATAFGTASPSRRHVTFKDQEGFTEGKRSAELATTPLKNSNESRGIFSPQRPEFSAPRAKPLNPFKKIAKTTMVTPMNSTATSPSGNRPLANMVLGDSQMSMMSTVEREETPPPPESRNPVFTAACSSGQRPSVETFLPAPTFTAAAASGAVAGGGDSPHAAKGPQSAAAKFFCPKALPVARPTPPPVVVPDATETTSPAAVDPFFGPSDDPPATLEAVLSDAGHDSQPSGVPCSASFGEALRRRYREEEDEGGEDGDGVGLELPRIAF